MARFRDSNDSGSRSRGGRSRRPDRRRNSNVEMTTVVCDECSRTCEVPFKPNSDKPIYCDVCFKKKGGGKGSGYSKVDYGVELGKINEKLDKIMKSLKLE